MSWEEAIESSRVDEGAPNGSVPQNICSSGECLLAGSSKIIVSLEGKPCWEIDNSGCLSGFWAQNSWYVLFFRRPPSPPPPFRMEGVNFANRPHPISYRLKVHLAGWELVHHTCWEWGTCRCWREIHSLSSGTIALFFLRYEMTVEGKLVLRMACALSSRLSSIQRNLKIRALQIDAAMSAHTLLFLRSLMLNTLEHARSRTKVKY